MGARLKPKKSLLDGKQMGRVIRRMANQLVELNRGSEELVLVGIRTRGVPLAELLAAELERLEGHTVPLGTLDITLYRDDLSTIAPSRWFARLRSRAARSTAASWCCAMTCCTPAARSERRWTP